MSVTLWLLILALMIYLVGRRKSRKNLVMFAQLIGFAAVCLVVGQVIWQILQQ